MRKKEMLNIINTIAEVKGKTQKLDKIQEITNNKFSTGRMTKKDVGFLTSLIHIIE